MKNLTWNKIFSGCTALVVFSTFAAAQGIEDAAAPDLDTLAQRQCDSPQNLTGPVSLQTGGNGIYGMEAVWDGAAYGVVWESDIAGNPDIWFARVAADGMLLSGPLQVTTDPANQYFPSIVWTGTEYGLAWDDTRNDCDIYFARISASGMKVSGDLRITDDPNVQANPCIVWTDLEYGLVWADNRNGNWDIYFAHLNSAGEKVGSDVPVTMDGSAQGHPILAWTGTEYGVAWEDSRTPPGIFFARLDAAGTNVSGDLQATSNPGLTQEIPSLVWTGTEYGVAWADWRNGNSDIYFNRLNSNGGRIGTDLQITSLPSAQAMPSLAWTGAEYGLAWEDNRSGNYDVFFIRLNPDGTLPATETALSAVSADEFISHRSLAFGTRGYGLAWELIPPCSLRVAGIGCHDDSTPPSCPVSPAEVSRTTTPSHTVTLAWGPSQDYESEIARYIITRNGVDVGTTAERAWTDSTFDPTKGYVYWITALNAAGYASMGCDGNVDTGDHIPPACPGNLMATGVTPGQIVLGWLPSSDEKSGVWKYRVFRNDAWIGEAAWPDATYADTTVSPDTTYNYAVTTMDWAGNEQTDCQSLWVSTAPITLKMTKNADGINADLDWTDVNISEYVVYRSPLAQTASELKRVPINFTTDPVLKDGVHLWFYYIQQRE